MPDCFVFLAIDGQMMQLTITRHKKQNVYNAYDRNLTAGQHFAWRFVLFILLFVFILLLGGLLLFLVGRTADVQLNDILENEIGSADRNQTVQPVNTLS